MKSLLFKAAKRGILGNDKFRIQSVFSNRRQGTGRPDGFGPLIVFNDDIVSPEGFLGMHRHENIEVITILLEGGEFQEDNQGTKTTLLADNVQLISSGSGVMHSSGNPSKSSNARNLQIWFEPKVIDSNPEVQLKTNGISEKTGVWELQISPDGRQDSLIIKQDAWLSKGRFLSGTAPFYQLYAPGNGVMIYVVDGKIKIGRDELDSNDTLFLYQPENFKIDVIENAHIQVIETFAQVPNQPY
ncbi:redox-sensitive bicupin YhaK (pirin superfamily) [Mucilaginibacter sp. UYP25]|uniref:pirin family protein n=1 Tax=unclassified Mucilaginibacter TaxID=2617802 RepID=UPI0033949937